MKITLGQVSGSEYRDKIKSQKYWEHDNLYIALSEIATYMLICPTTYRQ